MKALRIYYNNAGQVIYNIGLEGSGDFPRTVEEELLKLPPDTKLLEITSSQQISDFLNHRDNLIVDGNIVLGKSAVLPLVNSINRNALNELDALKQKLIDKGIFKVGDL